MSFLSFRLPLKSYRWWHKDLSCLLLPLIKTEMTSWLQMPSCGSFSLCITTQPNLFQIYLKNPFFTGNIFLSTVCILPSFCSISFYIYVYTFFFSLTSFFFLKLWRITTKFCIQGKILHHIFHKLLSVSGSFWM